MSLALPFDYRRFSLFINDVARYKSLINVGADWNRLMFNVQRRGLT